VTRFRTLLRGVELADGMVIGAIACIAFGLGQVPAPWGAVLAPIAVGIGLIVAVRFGTP
jgi:hypothetical protein